MANGGGTPGKSWLNWDTNYNESYIDGFSRVWMSIEFLSKDQGSSEGPFDQSKWTNLYQNAYDYGKAFASHFGPGHAKLAFGAEGR